jgi:pimeloyl-ACP methyl ester carboxylesterase
MAAFGAQHPTILADVGSDDEIGAMADRLLAAAPDRFLLAGLSMGGMVAMEAMARAPDRLAGVALIATDPTPARLREIEWRAGLIGEPGSPLDRYIDRFVPRFFGHDTEVASALGPVVASMAREVPPEVGRAQAHALDRRREMLPLIAGFPAPVEIVVGTEDRICPPLLHRPLAGGLPDARLTEIEGVGHLAAVEAPAAVNACVERLIRRVERR